MDEKMNRYRGSIYILFVRVIWTIIASMIQMKYFKWKDNSFFSPKFHENYNQTDLNGSFAGGKWINRDMSRKRNSRLIHDILEWTR